MASDERSRDLILKPNEFAYVLDNTKGQINCACGAYKVSLSNSDQVVNFDEETKRFVEVPMSIGIHTFITAPEGWYIELKNPVAGNKHPSEGTLNSLPELMIGKKINVRGGDGNGLSFALYPGQMAKVIKGHSLKTNEYLLARVYDTENLDKKYNVGQMLIIKGNETPFFIPETGIEVLPITKGGEDFIRKAVTLESLQYTILVSESGKRRYVHGPAVVFPEVDEAFVINEETNTPIFKAIELSDISGIYCKVISPYDEIIDGEGTIEEIDEVVTVEGETEEEEVIHKVDNPPQLIHHEAGEELFITGKNGNNIYMPRPEHQIISYEGKILHHAIAIPEGEGRYVLERLTGKVKTVFGPCMYLPDPRYEVVAKRKLTKKECELWYPGNKEVLRYNCPEVISTATLDNAFSTCTYTGSSALNIVPSGSISVSNCCTAADVLQNGFLGQKPVTTDKKFEISRGNTYSKPRTVTIDNKYEVVTIDVWTGYAVSVVSKSGNRRLIIGPKSSNILDYDETLEIVDNTVYLKYENNRISDVISVQTKDYVCVDVELVYNVNFELSHKDKWFSIENYKQYLIDTTRSIIKKEAKQYTIEEFYASAADIIKKAIIGAESDPKSKKLIVFSNGMYVSDVEILSVDITDSAVSELLHKHQQEIVEKTLKLSSTNKEMNVITELAKLEREKVDIQYKNKLYELELNSKFKQEEQKSADEYRKLVEATKKAEKEHEKEIQTLCAAIEKIELAAAKEKATQELNLRKEAEKLAIEREKSHTENIKKTFDSISPDLISAIQSASDNDMLRSVSENIAPWALASNESVSDVVNKLLRGTSLEGLIDKVIDTKNKD